MFDDDDYMERKREDARFCNPELAVVEDHLFGYSPAIWQSDDGDVRRVYVNEFGDAYVAWSRDATCLRWVCAPQDVEPVLSLLRERWPTTHRPLPGSAPAPSEEGLDDEDLSTWWLED